MIWGPGSVTTSNLNRAKESGKVLLGFNEPDFASQSNMSVTQALDLWPQLQATGLRLGSPAVATGGATAGGWLDRFMTGARERGLRVDFITLHWYGSDFSTAAVNHLASYIRAVHDRYQLPIWLTEYALIKFGSGGSTYPTAAQQTAFVNGSTTDARRNVLCGAIRLVRPADARRGRRRHRPVPQGPGPHPRRHRLPRRQIGLVFSACERGYLWRAMATPPTDVKGSSGGRADAQG